MDEFLLIRGPFGLCLGNLGMRVVGCVLVFCYFNGVSGALRKRVI